MATFEGAQGGASVSAHNGRSTLQKDRRLLSACRGCGRTLLLASTDAQTNHCERKPRWRGAGKLVATSLLRHKDHFGATDRLRNFPANR